MSLTLKKIDELIDALLKNANSLINESKLLHNHGYYTRAFSLAHFAREELSKIVMLQAAGMKVISGHDVDWKKLMRRFRNHKDKIRLETINTSMLFAAAEQHMMMENLLISAEELAEFRNDQKNSSLYVEIKEGSISTPLALIDEKKSDRTIKIAELSLLQQKNYISIVGNYQGRQPIKLNIPNIERMTAEEMINQMKIIAPIFNVLLAEHSVDENDQQGTLLP